MKYIEKKTIAEIPKATGSVSDTLNVEDKITNAPSINLVQQMAGIPQDGVIAFDGDEIPEGYEEVQIAGGTGSNDIYSTEETVVGTWMGKPLYRKVINFGALPNNTAKTVSTGVSNIKDIIKITGISNNTEIGGDAYMPLPLVSIESKYAAGLAYAKNDNVVRVTTAMDRSEFKETYITIEYTKTTD